MRVRPVAAAVIISTLSVATAHAAAPTGATNKSVELNWRETRTDRILWSGKINSFSIQNRLTIYVSSQGQVFSELLRNGNVVRQAGSDKPQGNNDQRTWKFNNWHFEGRALVGLQGFGPTGARRLGIEFDDSFRGCRATIQSGRTGPAKTTIATYMENGVQAEVLSETIEPPTCAVREGNAFGH
jgi:hypothetical protein